MLFGLLLPIFPGGAEGLCVFVYVVAAMAMLVPVFQFEFWSVFRWEQVAIETFFRSTHYQPTPINPLQSISPLNSSYQPIYWTPVSAFLVLEMMVGMFNSCGATLRSRYYPEGLQSSIMTVRWCLLTLVLQFLCFPLLFLCTPLSFSTVLLIPFPHPFVDPFIKVNNNDLTHLTSNHLYLHFFLLSIGIPTAIESVSSYRYKTHR